MAEWSVVDAAPVVGNEQQHQMQPQDGGWHEQAANRVQQRRQQPARVAAPETSQPRRKLQLNITAAAPAVNGPADRQLSPRVREVIRTSQRYSPLRNSAKKQGPQAAPSAGPSVDTGLSLGAVAQARNRAAPHSIAIARYVDEASPVAYSSSSERGEQWSAPLRKLAVSRLARGGESGPDGAAADKKRTQPLVGVTKMDYWKVWNTFLQNKADDPRIILPAGVQQADIERVGWRSKSTRLNSSH